MANAYPGSFKEICLGAVSFPDNHKPRLLSFSRKLEVILSHQVLYVFIYLSLSQQHVSLLSPEVKS